MDKDLSHFWELGGGRALTSLIDISLDADTLPATFAIITLDLSRPSMVHTHTHIHIFVITFSW
jgi:hypothetical protein